MLKSSFMQNVSCVVYFIFSLDEDPLMSTFIVFMHTMLSAAIDPTFLGTILQNEEGLSLNLMKYLETDLLKETRVVVCTGGSIRNSWLSHSHAIQLHGLL
jgi:hypothetical protein